MLRGRCRAWRPQRSRDDHPFAHDPGDCRICWAPCFKHARPGTAFCQSCWGLLSNHPSAAVRNEVVSRPDIPRTVLEDMAEDSDARVMFAAEERIRQLNSDQTEVDFI